MNFDHRKFQVAVTGTSGSGKTLFGINLFLRRKARWKMAFDPEGEMSVKLGASRCVTTSMLNQELAAGRIACFDPARLFEGDWESGFDFFCRWCFSCSAVLPGTKLVIVDEIQEFTNVGRGGCPDSLSKLMRLGRRQGIDLIVMGQRLNEMHDSIRSQCVSGIVTFCHTDPLPLKWLGYRGFDIEKVRALQYPGGYIWRDTNSGKETHGTNSDGQRKGSRLPSHTGSEARGGR